VRVYLLVQGDTIDLTGKKGETDMRESNTKSGYEILLISKQIVKKRRKKFRKRTGSSRAERRQQL